MLIDESVLLCDYRLINVLAYNRSLKMVHCLFFKISRKWKKAQQSSIPPENARQKVKPNKKVEIFGRREAPLVRWKTFGTKQYSKNPRHQTLRRRTFWSPLLPRPFRTRQIKRVLAWNGRPPCSKFLSGPWAKAPFLKYLQSWMDPLFKYVLLHITVFINKIGEIFGPTPRQCHQMTNEGRGGV